MKLKSRYVFRVFDFGLFTNRCVFVSIFIFRQTCLSVVVEIHGRFCAEYILSCAYCLERAGVT